MQLSLLLFLILPFVALSTADQAIQYVYNDALCADYVAHMKFALNECSVYNEVVSAEFVINQEVIRFCTYNSTVPFACSNSNLLLKCREFTLG